MPLADHHWTVDDLATLPDDGNRYEILDGRLLVTPAPAWRHQLIVGAVYRRIAAYLEEHPFAVVIVAPADVPFSRDTSFQPDLFVVPLVDGRTPAAFGDVRRLLLAVEVLSPGTMRTDRYEKRPRFQKEQVPETWIVDGDARAVERWRPDDQMPEVLQAELTWQPDPEHPPLVIDLPAVFREVAVG
jgi:Uma2 family endonuclease